MKLITINPHPGVRDRSGPGRGWAGGRECGDGKQVGWKGGVEGVDEGRL